ncbi:MAG: OmpA family protein [Bacteroidota bacterium]|nr:OmpA family protein [Bacteroidota bacterium]
MKHFFLIALFFLVPLAIFAQKYQNAFEYLEQGDFEKARHTFEKAEKKLPTLERYGKAIIYFNPEYPKYSIIKAYKYSKYALGRYKRSENKKELKEDYGITGNLLETLRDSVAEHAYQNLSFKNNTAQLTEYLNVFSESNLHQGITRRRDSLAFSEAVKKGSFRDYQAFFISYPEALQVDEAKKQYRLLWKGIYEEVLQTGELLAISAFEEKYSDFPYYSDYKPQHKILAERGRNLAFEKGYKVNYAAKYDKFIKDAAPKDIAFVALQLLISESVEQGDYRQAEEIVKKYDNYFKNSHEVEKLTQLLKQKNTGSYKPNKLAGEVNTKGWEYAASVTADGKQLVFCGRNREGNLEDGMEDIFYSKKKNGKWTKPVLVSDLSTSYMNEAPLSISADGTRMLMFSEGDIYYSDKTQKGWTRKKIFPQLNLYEAWEADAMMTADGNAVFYISDRVGGTGMPVRFGKAYHGGRGGNTDIYVSEMKNGEWSKPINIGSVVNTPYAERSPFLHADMKTLYFSSQGHAGFGALDVFMSKRLNDTSWTEWSEPVNLGKGINTESEEYDYEISGDGIEAYFSYFGGKDPDIYKTQLPKNLRPETTTRIYGTIKNSEGQILSSEIIWENLDAQKEIGRSKSDPGDGAYIITLPNGKNYGFFVQTPGYYPISGSIDLSEAEKMQEIEKNFVLISEQKIIEGNETIALKNLFFEHNKHTLQKTSYPELNRFAVFFLKYPAIKIEISGHTDNIGKADYNKSLSKARAQAVKDYLVQKGCKTEKMTVKGYGSELPRADNKTQSGRAKNRRVEFKVIK